MTSCTYSSSPKGSRTCNAIGSCSISDGRHSVSSLRLTESSTWSSWGQKEGPVQTTPNSRFASESFSGSVSVGKCILHGNEKEHLRQLNDRLAGYMDKVKLLEQTNQNLENQIKEIFGKVNQTPDLSNFYNQVEELKGNAHRISVENTQLALAIDNGKEEAKEFRIKIESETAAMRAIEYDIGSLNQIVEKIQTERKHLDEQLGSLQREMESIRGNHNEKLQGLRVAANDEGVQVKVDDVRGADLVQILADMRSEYENITQKSRADIEAIYQTQIEHANPNTAQNLEAIELAKKQANDLRRQMQALTMDIQTQSNAISSLKSTLNHSEERYSYELNKFLPITGYLEEELSKIKGNLEHQRQEYDTALNAKMMLEMEIATYRQLLEAGGARDGEQTDDKIVYDVPDYDIPRKPSTDSNVNNASNKQDPCLDNRATAKPPGDGDSCAVNTDVRASSAPPFGVQGTGCLDDSSRIGDRLCKDGISSLDSGLSLPGLLGRKSPISSQGSDSALYITKECKRESVLRT